jgi:alpha-tubulin suppressor-like RCC1 family protein
MQLSDVDSNNTCSPPAAFAAAVNDGSDPTTSSATATGVFHPMPVSGVTNFGIIADVAVGFAHTCASTVDGKVLCWGNNNRGQLGIGTDLLALGSCLVNQNCPVATPTPVVGQDGKRLSGFGTVAAGSGGHVCATQWAGAACWGGNDSGELGTGVPSFGEFSSAQPTIFPETTRQIAIGDNHTCVLDVSTDPDILCVGDGREGQTGRGPDDNSATWELKPVKWQ